jgi:hypothetical protein
MENCIVTDESDRFEYEDKNGKVSTNRPGVVQWAVAIKIALQGVAFLVLALAAAYTLYARGGDVVSFLSTFFGK